MSLFFAELMCDFPYADTKSEHIDSLPDESLFLISMDDPWYRDFLLYLQTQHFHPSLSRDEHHHILHHVNCYLILGDALYHYGIDSILRRFLRHDEAEFTLMTITQEHVAVTFLGQIWLRKFYALVNFVLRSLNIVWKQSKSAPLFRFFIQRSALLLLHCIQQLLSSLLQNGTLISCNVRLPQPRGTVM